MLARIWPAPELPRRGAVWTHALVVGFAELRTRGLRSLLSLLRRPSGEELDAYSERLPWPEASPARLAPPAASLAPTLVWAALGEPEGPRAVICRQGDERHAEDALIWAARRAPTARPRGVELPHPRPRSARAQPLPRPGRPGARRPQRRVRRRGDRRAPRAGDAAAKLDTAARRRPGGGAPPRRSPPPRGLGCRLARTRLGDPRSAGRWRASRGSPPHRRPKALRSPSGRWRRTCRRPGRPRSSTPLAGSSKRAGRRSCQRHSWTPSWPDPQAWIPSAEPMWVK